MGDRSVLNRGAVMYPGSRTGPDTIINALATIGTGTEIGASSEVPENMAIGNGPPDSGPQDYRLQAEQVVFHSGFGQGRTLSSQIRRTRQTHEKTKNNTPVRNLRLP